MLRRGGKQQLKGAEEGKDEVVEGDELFYKEKGGEVGEEEEEEQCCNTMCLLRTGWSLFGSYQ